MVARIALAETDDPGVGGLRILRLAPGNERLDPQGPGPGVEVLVASAGQGDGLVGE